MNCKGKLISLEKPKVMGILNLTPDSFFAESRVSNEKVLLKKAEEMLKQGVDFIDVGGYSSRPGATEISENTELERVLPAIEILLKNFPEIIISIDTFRAKLAQLAIEAGAALVNDISGGNLDTKMFETVAKLQVPYILMHMQGKPKNMQEKPEYANITKEILDYLVKKIYELRQLALHDIIIDPGFGFGKTLAHNYELLRNLSLFEMLDCPILVGVSRKSMVYNLLNIKPEKALNGTTALHMLALERGAKILRVHDVLPAKEAIEIFWATKRNC